jgi:hypothetical protein
MRTVQLHSRSRIIPFPPRRSPHKLVACSVCLRVREGDEWVDVDDAIRRLRTFERKDVVRLRGALCDRCEFELRQRRGSAPDRLAA